MRKILLTLTIAALGAIALRADIRFTPERKLAFAEQIIAGYYVDEIDTAKIVEDAIVAMLKDLDPHSTYTNAEETRELTEPLAGNFSGIGIRFQTVRDTLYVIEAISGGPSERAGILPGDRIISCNDTVIAGVKMPNSKILRVLRGPRGTIARLCVKRKSSPTPIEFSVTRDEIPIYSVDASYMVNDSIGLISIARFAGTTTDEVNDAMKKLRRHGMKHLIIDLTDNGGGYLKPATEIANKFLSKGDMLVYTDSPKNGPTYYEANRDGDFRDGRIVVMVNQYSASASEILSGAIQDNDRGVIVGRRTFGKGLVQRPFPFPDGSMMRLTVSRYYTPAGRCIQKPYTNGDDDGYRMDIANRYTSGEFNSADSIVFSDSLLCHTIRLGRPVYGGGGIMPDQFVPIDTTYFSTYYRDLVAKGTINYTALAYVDGNRADLKKEYPSENDFIKGFEVSPEIMDTLVKNGEKDEITFDPEAFNTSYKYIASIIKGLIGSDLYGQSMYAEITNPYNRIYSTAVDIITDPSRYNSYLTAPAKIGTDYQAQHK